MTRKARAQSKDPWQQAERAEGVLTTVAVFFLASSVFLENASSADLPKEDRQPQRFSRASQDIHIHSPLLTGAPAAETLELQKEIDSFEKQSEEVEKATNPKLPQRDEQALREKATSSSLSVNRNSSKTVLWEEDRVEHFYVNQFTSITLILPKDEEVVKPREDVSMADLSSLAAFVNERRPNIVYLTPVLVDTTTSLVIFGKRRNYFILLTTTKNSAKASLVVRYKLPFSDEASFDALFDNAYPTATNANEKSTPKKSPQKKSKTGKKRQARKKKSDSKILSTPWSRSTRKKKNLNPILCNTFHTTRPTSSMTNTRCVRARAKEKCSLHNWSLTTASTPIFTSTAMSQRLVPSFYKGQTT